MVAVGQDRDFAKQALEARMLAELSRFPSFDLQDLDSYLALGFHVQSQFYPTNIQTKHVRNFLITQEVWKLTLRSGHGRLS